MSEYKILTWQESFDKTFRYLAENGLFAKGGKVEKVKKPKGAKTRGPKSVGKGNTKKVPDLLRM